MKLNHAEAQVVAQLMDECRTRGDCSACQNRVVCSGMKVKLIAELGPKAASGDSSGGGDYDKDGPPIRGD